VLAQIRQTSGEKTMRIICFLSFWIISLAIVNCPTAAFAANEYYVVYRYMCLHEDNSDAGSCDVTTRGNSCQQAAGAQQSVVASAGGDPCKRCSGVADLEKHWSGTADHIQGGPCQGW
jgi:hypothetical protein